MTVKELRATLANYPKDAQVFLHSTNVIRNYRKENI